jgi:ribosomal protein S18 acetylase RimI-like enzyme
MEVKIEKLETKDLNEFWEVFSQILQNDFPGYTKAVVDYFLTKVYTKINFNHWLTTGWKIVLIAKNAKEEAKDAKNKDKIVGFAVLDKPYGGVCFCRWLGVLPEFRKKSLGKRLIDEWVNFAKNYGCHKVEISSQPKARDFYQKVGLNLEGRRELSYFGIDQYIFGKVIGQPDDGVMTKD